MEQRLSADALLSNSFFLTRRFHKKIFSTVGLSIFFTLLVVAGLGIQQNLIMTGQLQRTFWTQVSRLCPDMTENTVILMEFNDDSYDQGISFGGRFPRILGYIYKFPDRWTDERDFRQATQPKPHRMVNGWRERVTLGDDNQIKITADEVLGRDFQPRFFSSNTILLTVQNNLLTRQTELVLKNITLPLKPNNSSFEMPPYRSNVLFDDLIIP
ncbi:MAG: hypothetical protein HC895_20175 [Leptolyngbyaceae cyanobacterium SM1_3_5]|nr:hypothetical protein [Leptolyngbyaceae cyanobacterium SM1_3_5]